MPANDSERRVGFSVLEQSELEMADNCSQSHRRFRETQREYEDQTTNSLVMINKIQIRRWRYPNLSILKNLLIVQIILSHLNSQLDQLNYIASHAGGNGQPRDVTLSALLPRVLLAGAIECSLDGDCGNREKICHENKCICARDKPIEDQERCLALSLIGEQCSLTEQCLGNSVCMDGICSCGSDAISLFNPSAKIFYCHLKRRLNEECNHDSQCPTNSYCSTNKFGCLCQNGFAPANVNNAGIETLECLPKFCSISSSCESEFHFCEENKCKCLATHFDPTSAKCYKFGSTGGKSANDDLLALADPNGPQLNGTSGDDKFYSILKDLTENGDKMWIVLIVLILLSILLFALIFMLVRKYYLGYCWSAHKKEYEPNNKNAPKNGYFNKDSINNKSFRQKSGEIDNNDNYEDEDEDVEAAPASDEDRSNLVGGGDGGGRQKQRLDYVKVDLLDNDRPDLSDSGAANYHHHHHHHQLSSPLKSSTSTPV